MITSSAVVGVPKSFVIGVTFGSYFPLSGSPTLTVTFTWSFDPSGYVTVTGIVYVPGVLPFGNVLGSSTLTFGAGLSLG